MDKNFIIADYYAETYDEKIKGKVAIRRDTIVAAYSIAGYSKRTLIMTDGGLKFAVKGKLESFNFSGEKVLTEA